MEEIRLIKGEKDEEAFSYLASYCFIDKYGWTNHIFPLLFGDKAWGIFVDNNLASAVISKSYLAYIFDTRASMSGISTVESSPQYRNRGYVRKLLHKILYENLKDGFLFSTLTPFKYKFYEKFGYSYLGGTTFTSFTPENINVQTNLEGEFIPFAGNERHLSDMYYVHDTWVRNFTCGIKSRRLPLDRFMDELKWYKNYLFLYYKNNECKAYIRFKLTSMDVYSSKLEIKKIAWTDKEGFQGLLHFLKAHRDQNRSIEWNMPGNIPVHIACKNIRISQNLRYDFMIRPIDVLKILRLKAGHSPAVEKISFSIEDPVISENNGTYIVEGNKVEKKSYNGKNKLPFPLFSSLTFGAFSLKDAELAGLMNISLPTAAYSFFHKSRNIYLSELF